MYLPHSILGRVVRQAEASREPNFVSVVDCMQADGNFNTDIDQPVNVERIHALNMSQDNW